MEIILIRHAKVNYRYKKMYRHFEYDNACKEYDESPVSVTPDYKCHCIADAIYVSSLQRTHHTAELILPDKKYVESNLFDEVPIRSFAKLPFPMPTMLWFFIGRLQWLFGLRRQPETKQDTEIRAQKAADVLERESGPIIVICHGVFMRMLVREFKNRGYSMKGKATYKNLDEICLYKP